MRTRARAAELARCLPAGLRSVIAAACWLLLICCFAGCVGPGLEPPARDDQNSGSPGAAFDGGVRPPPTAQGGSGGSFGNTGDAGGSAAGSGPQAGGSGNAGSPDTTAPDAGTPAFDAGADEDGGTD
jgi:hypothetical protein